MLFRNTHIEPIEKLSGRKKGCWAGDEPEQVVSSIAEQKLQFATSRLYRYARRSLDPMSDAICRRRKRLKVLHIVHPRLIAYFPFSEGKILFHFDVVSVIRLA